MNKEYVAVDEQNDMVLRVARDLIIG